jgi:MFS family permease
MWLVPIERAWMLFAMAGIFGFAFGGCAVSHSPLVAELFGLRSHGLIFGVFSISVSAGAAIGPLMTGYIFDVNHSYQMAFLVCAVISVIGILLTGFLIFKKSRPKI